MPTPLDETRRTILSELLGAFKAPSGVLFEACSGSDAFEVVPPSIQSDNAIGRFEATSLAVRWLRVNRASLPVPDGIGIYEHLTLQERALLGSLDTKLLVPLCHKRRLVGFVSLTGAGRSPSGMAQRLASWAASLATGHAAAASAEKARYAERANRLSMAGQMAAGIAHEVRNPLAAIRSSVQLVRDGDVAVESAAGLLGGALEEIDRISAVLGTVVSAGRAAESRKDLVDLATLARHAVDFLRSHSRLSGVNLTFTSAASQVHAHADPAEIRQILINLLLNACQASAQDATVTLDLTTEWIGERKCALLRVRDQGVGMASADIAQAFEPFFTTKADGGGLGLAVCQEIAERNGWSVTLHSALGKGTVATLSIPLEP